MFKNYFENSENIRGGQVRTKHNLESVLKRSRTILTLSTELLRKYRQAL